LTRSAIFLGKVRWATFYLYADCGSSGYANIQLLLFTHYSVLNIGLVSWLFLLGNSSDLQKSGRFSASNAPQSLRGAHCPRCFSPSPIMLPVIIAAAQATTAILAERGFDEWGANPTDWGFNKLCNCSRASFFEMVD
jgi:hypothetical protein